MNVVLFMRLAAEFKAGVMPKCLVKYRKHSNSLTGKSINRWWIEKQMTLDAILNTKPELKDKYLKEFKLAYAKVSYYKSIYEYSVGNDAQGRVEIEKRYETLRLSFVISYGPLVNV